MCQGTSKSAMDFHLFKSSSFHDKLPTNYNAIFEF